MNDNKIIHIKKLGIAFYKDDFKRAVVGNKGLILDIQIREEKLNRREVLDFLVSLFSEELKYFIEPYKYKCPNILSMIKNYKESLLEVFGGIMLL